MKIIFSTYESKEIGGSYLRSLALARGLVQLKHQVTLWTSAKNVSLMPKISVENGVLVIESIGLFPKRFRKGGYDPFDLLFRSLVILFSKADILHSFNHRPVATWPFLLKSLLSQSKWFLDWADLWGNGGIADRRCGKFRFITANVDHYTEQLFIKLPYAVTPISDDLVKKALKIRQNKDKVFFLGVGANIEDIKPLNKIEARKKLNLKINKKILVYLYVGTYDEELLAKTFIALSKLDQNAQLMLLGPKLINFEKILNNYPKISQRVLRFGVVDRNLLATYLAAGDIMLLPFAKKEINLGKFPNKLGDYLAAGRPIVTNPTGEIKKILEKYEVGMLVSQEPKIFAQAIADLLKNKNKMKKLGKNARQLALKLSWKSVADQLEAFYLK